MIDFIIPIVGFLFAIFTLQNLQKTKPHFEFLGLKIPMLIRLAIIGILIAVVLLLHDLKII